MLTPCRRPRIELASARCLPLTMGERRILENAQARQHCCASAHASGGKPHPPVALLQSRLANRGLQCPPSRNGSGAILQRGKDGYNTPEISVPRRSSRGHFPHQYWLSGRSVSLPYHQHCQGEGLTAAPHVLQRSSRTLPSRTKREPKSPQFRQFHERFDRCSWTISRSPWRSRLGPHRRRLQLLRRQGPRKQTIRAAKTSEPRVPCRRRLSRCFQ